MHKSMMGSQEPNQSLTNKPGFYYGYIILLCAFISIVADYILPNSYGIFFKPMALELRWDRTIISGAYSLNRIAAGLMSIVAGWLIDRMGARLVLIICSVLCGLGSLMISQISSVWQLYLIYGVIIGTGTSAFAPMVATVAKWFVRRRTMMTGIIISGVPISTLIGPPILNNLISEYGWRLSYIISGAIITAVIIIAAQFMRREPRIVWQIVENKKEDEQEEFKSLNDSFSLIEAVHTRQFWIYFFMSICYALCYMSLIVHFVPYITDFGIPAITAANVLAAMGGAIIVGLILMGNIGDKIGNKSGIIIGYFLMSLTMFLFPFLKETWLFYIFASIFGFAFGCISTQRPPLVANMFGVKSHGLIFSVLDNSFSIGAAIGPLLYGYIFDTFGSYMFAFWISGGIAVAGLILTILLKPKIKKKYRNLYFGLHTH